MKVLKEKTNRYYKYTETSYSSGGAGGMYYYWDEYKAGATCAQIFFAIPTVITSINMLIGGWTNEFHEGYVDNIILQACNDGSSWINVKGFGNRQGCNTWHTLDCSDNTTAYNYYRFYAENRGWAYNDALSVASVEYLGHYTTIIDGTAQDYDFIISGGKCYTLKKENVKEYYKYTYNTFTQPALSSNDSNINFIVSGTNGNSKRFKYPRLYKRFMFGFKYFFSKTIN